MLFEVFQEGQNTIEAETIPSTINYSTKDIYCPVENENEKERKGKGKERKKLDS